MDSSKFERLDHYTSDRGFSDRERAALDYVTELTRTRQMHPATFARLGEHFSEREVCEIVYLVASQFLGNIGYIGLHIGSDDLCKRAPSPRDPKSRPAGAKETTRSGLDRA